MPFEPLLDRSVFTCGKASLDDWFHHYSGQQEKRSTARTTFGVDEKEARIASFFSLVTYRLEVDQLVGTPLGARVRYPMSAMLLARLAVDQQYQGTGLGGLTLAHALGRLAEASVDIGFEVVLVDAIDDEAAGFYRRYGFQTLSDDGARLFMRTDDLRATFAEGETS